MNCQEIDKLVDLALFESDPAATQTVMDHISYCDRCSKRYGNLKAASSFMDKLRKTTPGLEISETVALTNSIMDAVSEPGRPAQITQKKGINTLSLIIRILAAASVLLFMTLSIEQYLIVEKVRKLEKNLQLTESIAVERNYNFLSMPLRETDLKRTEQLTGLVENLKKNSFRTLLLRNRILNQPPVNYGMLSDLLTDSKNNEIINEIFARP